MTISKNTIFCLLVGTAFLCANRGAVFATITWTFSAGGGDITGFVDIDELHPDYAPSSTCSIGSGCITDFSFEDNIGTGIWTQIPISVHLFESN